MKISKDTLAYLKNFSTINMGISVEKGQILKTCSVAKDVIGIVEVEESFPVDFSIYNVPQLLSTLSIFEDPDLAFKENFITIKEENTSTKYNYTDPDNVQSVPSGFDVGETEGGFCISTEELTKLIKSATILKLTELVFETCEEGLNVTAKDPDNANSHTYSVLIPRDGIESDFNFKLGIKKLNLIPVDYFISISDKCAVFEGVDVPIVYYIGYDL